MNSTHNMLMRARVTEVDDSDGQQRVNVAGMSGVRLDGIWRFQPYGLTSTPPVGAEGLLLAPGGHLDRAVFLAGEVGVNRPVGLGAGAQAIYNSAGAIVSLVNRAVRIVGGTVEIKADQIALNGQVFLGGGFGSGVPASKEGTLDSAGHAETSNLANRVFVT